MASAHSAEPRRLRVRLTMAAGLFLVMFPLEIPAQTQSGPAPFILPDRGVDGNRLAAQTVPLDELSYSRLTMGASPRWVFALPAGVSRTTTAGRSDLWWIVGDGGVTVSVSLGSDGPSLRVLPVTFDGVGPPALIQTSGGWKLVSLPELHQALLSPDMLRRIRPLEDAQPSFSEQGFMAIPGGPTSRYSHGILGDAVEASVIYVLNPETGRLTEIDNWPAVVEERGVLWTDIDGDGEDDVVTTISDARVGATIAAYRSDGTLLATGPAVGTGYRWRHLIGAGTIFPDRTRGLLSVKTPHIGGVVEFSRYVDDIQGDDSGDETQLEILAETSRYSSHRIGDRNLGYAALADITGDGIAEIVLPSQTQNDLVAIGLETDARSGAFRPRVVWRAALRARVSSNLSFSARPEQPGLLVGTEDGTLHVWWRQGR